MKNSHDPTSLKSISNGLINSNIVTSKQTLCAFLAPFSCPNCTRVMLTRSLNDNSFQRSSFQAKISGTSRNRGVIQFKVDLLTTLPITSS